MVRGLVNRGLQLAAMISLFLFLVSPLVWLESLWYHDWMGWDDLTLPHRRSEIGIANGYIWYGWGRGARPRHSSDDFGSQEIAQSIRWWDLDPMFFSHGV